MRIEKLTLKGFLRFRDQVAIDLTSIPEGLVAIVGPNGTGKTTLLEAAPATIYRSFMSRGDVLDYATGRDSFLELQIGVEGQGTYRARVNCDGIKRSSDAVLEVVLPNGSRRVLNDGKVSTFDTAVAAVFPSKDVLLASAFAAQSKTGSFISLDKKGRKQLFGQLLGIERYETMSQTARQAATFAEQARMRLQARRDVLAADTSDRIADEIHVLANQLQADGGRAELDARQVTTTIDRLDARLATMSDVAAAYSAATQRIATLRTELETRRTERAGLDQDRTRTREQLLVDLRRLTTKRDADLAYNGEQVTKTADRETRETQDAVAKRDAGLAEIEKKVTGNQQILAMADRIRAAVAESEAIALEQQRMRDAVEQQLAVMEEQRQALARADAAIVALALPTQQLARAKADAALLQSVPCGGAGAFASCDFLGNAKAAEARIPELEATVSTRDMLAAEQSVLVEAMTSAQAALSTQRSQLATLAASATALQSLTKYAEPLAAAEARIAELENQKATVARDFESAVADAAIRRAQRQEELLAERAQVVEHADVDIRSHQTRADAALIILDQRASSLDETIARLEGEVVTAEADLQAADTDNRAVISVRAELAERRLERDRLIGIIARVESGRQELDRRRAELQEKRARLADINQRLQRLDDELLDWQTLTKAFGATGLPVLEIDAAGPTISYYTNELLQVCFGPRFSVDLVTQVAKADGKGTKEDFSIRVLDNTNGGDARDIADLSGGEQVIVAEALSNAICIYVNTRSSMPVRTCWRDETTGALDPENASRYMAMLRKVQELGGFAHILFISHNPDAAAQADAQIQLVDGTASVVFPPYARAEAA